MNRSPTLRFSHHAMASEFTITIQGVEADYARKAAKAAFREITLVEHSLSRFRHDSDITRINALKAGEQHRCSPHAAECLALARYIWMATGGAFDPAIGALLAWRAKNPDEQKIPEDIREKSGMDKLHSNEPHTVITVATEGLRVDLGAIGKGYGVDRAAALLRNDWEIPAALVQGGESSILGWGDGPGRQGWPLAIRNPANQEEILAVYTLMDFAMSGSGQVLHGDHIVDPRNGLRARREHGAWACAPSAAAADALSTAMMVLQPGESRALFDNQEEIGGLLHTGEEPPAPLGIWGRVGVLPAT